MTNREKNVYNWKMWQALFYTNILVKIDDNGSENM